MHHMKVIVYWLAHEYTETRQYGSRGQLDTTTPTKPYTTCLGLDSKLIKQKWVETRFEKETFRSIDNIDNIKKNNIETIQIAIKVKVQKLSSNLVIMEVREMSNSIH